MNSIDRNRFFSKAKECPSSGCWIWSAQKDKDGYGRFKFRISHGVFAQSPAHRIAWKMVFGPIKKGLLVCHKCDNPPCINPMHLFLGTCAENIADKVSKNRHRRVARGSKSGRAKLTEDHVLMIRSSSESRQTLAEKYNVSDTNIRQILKRQTWRHI